LECNPFPLNSVLKTLQIERRRPCQKQKGIRKIKKMVYLWKNYGILSHKANLTVARSILAALYGMWKKGEEYDRKIDIRRGIKSKLVHTIFLRLV
jgi:hypothetical protein